MAPMLSGPPARLIVKSCFNEFPGRPTVTFGPVYVKINSALEPAKISCDNVLERVRLPIITDASPVYPDVCTTPLVHPAGPGKKAETDPSTDSRSAVNCPPAAVGKEARLKKICDGEVESPSPDEC